MPMVKVISEINRRVQRDTRSMSSQYVQWGSVSFG
jgi:hypothetical protein